MVQRIYVEKKSALRQEARALCHELQTLLNIDGLKDVRILNRYDVEHLDKSAFQQAETTVFSEPQLDDTYETLPTWGAEQVFAVAYLPGQFDQRADSAAQCIQLMTRGDRPVVRTARVYGLFGQISDAELQRIKHYVINPVEAQETTLNLPETLDLDVTSPKAPAVLTGFRSMKGNQLTECIAQYGLAMDADDLQCCIDYFTTENRDPTLTELRILDTYWSDHCRHTTFSTVLTDIQFEDARVKTAYDRYLSIREQTKAGDKPITLMDMAVQGAKYLKQQGILKHLDESDEINACTVKIEVDVNGKTEPWLLLFKNETHNHPTEIEPFGGAATCIGGAIRDPLSGRGYVYQAMRVTGAADPCTPLNETIPGKLPQRKIVTTAADGYSSYGNQIGLATGLVDEMVHPGYVTKRLEIGAVVGAVPQNNVRREVPTTGDVVILVGGRTGRDGCGGATGSSKAHDTTSVQTCSAEVQKGNAPEERKLQRLFRNGDATRMIKRCNDFGAGGVSVAVGELADSLDINLDQVTKKYEGLDATELAISESQERMAVVVEAKDADAFIALAHEENLEANVVAHVTDTGHMVLSWHGQTVADLSRAFLNTNGAPKHTSVVVEQGSVTSATSYPDFKTGMTAIASDLNVCSKQGLSERFDATIGAGTVTMPFGGIYQKTPTQAMVAKLPVLHGETNTCSIMAWGGDPYRTSASPFRGAYLAVTDSIAKVIAAGGKREDCYLSLQEYFEKLGTDSKRWGKPTAALLGALEAQLDLGVGAIGGKDSMSGSFNDLDVPPTLVSFAVARGNVKRVITPEFKGTGHSVMLLQADCDKAGVPLADSLCQMLDTVEHAISDGLVYSASVIGTGGVAASVMKSTFGNRIGFAFNQSLSVQELFQNSPATILLEVKSNADIGTVIGTTTEAELLTYDSETLSLNKLETVYNNALEDIFPMLTDSKGETPVLTSDLPCTVAPKIGTKTPEVLIPVFPGTNCEYDSARAVERAGLTPNILVINNQSAHDVEQSVLRFAEAAQNAQIIFLPGGFSGGDEPDGSAKFITSFFRNPRVADATMALLNQRDGLMLGVCNGFQALIKLGLVPYGEIRNTDADSPTLTYNDIGRHQSKIVRTRIASGQSPWLTKVQPGTICSVPISHGEGKFLCPPKLLQELATNGQIATQYVDLDGNPSMDVRFNPNGSIWAVEGITSPDGRVFGKMGHSERIAPDLYQNVPGNYDLHLFEAASAYFDI